MRKQQAVDLFGSPSQLAEAIGVTRSAISAWPEALSDKIADRVVAAGIRAGKDPRRLQILAQRLGQKQKAA